MEVPPLQSLSPMRIVVLMPIRDDWVSSAELIRRVDKALCDYPCQIEILLVDDGSVQKCSADDFQFRYSVVRAIRLLRLRRNLGHQRAIAIGLVDIHKTAGYDAVAVMDGDGEDTPEGLLDLIRAYSSAQGATAIFAERSRRSESVIFKVFYQIYKWLHRGLTGISVRVGNFSILPSAHLSTLIVVSELWNHYAAAVYRSKLPFTMIPIPRGYRIAGASRMDFVALVSHGLSAISVFADVVGVRLLIISLMGSILAVLAIVLVFIIGGFTNAAIPGWPAGAAGLVAIIMIQFLTIACSFAFIMLSGRTNLGFVPLRDASLFVEDVREIYRCE
jgi:glycosyltransferase involved in cell wall biosynthesis